MYSFLVTTLNRLLILISIFIFGAFSGCTSITASNEANETRIIRVEADSGKGFNYPFFLVIPRNLPAIKPQLVVLPNNSSIIADAQLSEELAKKEAQTWKSELSERISAVLLVPAFPRTESIYTHALVRRSFSVDGPLKRIDLQLIKMTDEARVIVEATAGKTLAPRIFLFGFSASAMFVNRFAFIHPERVSAVALGAPGGWPLAPLRQLKGSELRYPIGIADLETLTGKPFDLEALKRVRFFIFLGAEDTNDSVVYRDGYTRAEQELVFKLFGDRPVSRWPIANELYRNAGLNAKFHLYRGVGHGTNAVIENDVVDFFKYATLNP